MISSSSASATAKQSLYPVAEVLSVPVDPPSRSGVADGDINEGRPFTSHRHRDRVRAGGEIKVLAKVQILRTRFDVIHKRYSRRGL